MLCEKCKQREATVHKQVVVGGVSHSEHLCSECAAKEGNSWEKSFGSIFGGDSFYDKFFGSPSLSNWFEPFFKLDGQTAPEKKKETMTPCPHCGTTWDEFQSNGLLGCSECYNHFADALPPLLRQLHSATEHTGKKPYDNVAAPVETKVEEKPAEKVLTKEEGLRAEMQKAIEAENFEEAARLRDEIKALGEKEANDEDHQ